MEDHEIYFVQESGKMIVKDLEGEERKKQSKKEKNRSGHHDNKTENLPTTNRIKENP